MKRRALRRRYGHAGKRRSAAAYAFLRNMHGWTITSERGDLLVAHRMASVQGEEPGPDVEFMRVKHGREFRWRAFYNGRVGVGFSPFGAARDVGVPR